MYRYNEKTGDFKYLLSFGSKKHQHYFDIIGKFKNLDHLDMQRKINFDKRFEKLIKKNENNPYSPMFWSSKYLWPDLSKI